MEGVTFVLTTIYDIKNVCMGWEVKGNVIGQK